MTSGSPARSRRVNRLSLTAERRRRLASPRRSLVVIPDPRIVNASGPDFIPIAFQQDCLQTIRALRPGDPRYALRSRLAVLRPKFQPFRNGLGKRLRRATFEEAGVLAGDFAKHSNIARQDRQSMLRGLDQR